MLKWQRVLFAPNALYIYNLFGISAIWISKNNNPNNLSLWPNMSKFTLFVKLYIVYYQKNVKNCVIFVLMRIMSFTYMSSINITLLAV